MGKTKRRTAPNAPTSRVWPQLLRALKVAGPFAVVALIVVLVVAWFDAEKRARDAELKNIKLTGEISALQIEKTHLTGENSFLKLKNADLTGGISALQLKNTRLRAELDKCDEARTILERAARPEPSEPLPPRVGKPIPASVRRFPADLRYVASGKMGDIGDVTFGGGEFKYKTAGTGPHEYEWKYEKDGRTESTRPAQFGGVVWMNPPGAFGTVPDGGYDLRGFRAIEWEARAIGDPVKVEFFIGGINRVWKKNTDGTWKFVRAPYPDTMPRRSLGTKKLTTEWQSFREPLADQPESNFARVVGGFGWIANWGNNGVEPNESGKGPSEVKKFTFEVRNVFYVKDIE